MKFTMYRVVAAFLILSIGFFDAAAQEMKKWTLKECVDLALEKNLRIKRGVYGVETARANLLQAKGSFLPTINAFGSYTNNYGRALNPTTNLFVDRNFTTGLVFIFMIGVILLATLALMPPFLQNLAGFPVITTGLVLAPRGIGTVFARSCQHGRLPSS